MVLRRLLMVGLFTASGAVALASAAGCGDDGPANLGPQAGGDDDAGSQEVTSGIDANVGGTGGGDGDAVAAPDTGSATATNNEPVFKDPLVAGPTVTLKGYSRGAGALLAVPGGIAACDGDGVSYVESDGSLTERLALSGECVALALEVDTLAVASDDGRWHVRQAGQDVKSMAGPVPLGLTIAKGAVFAALGRQGVMTAPLALDTAPAAVPGADDARALMAVGDTLLVADGRSGAKLLDMTGGGAVGALDGPGDFSVTSDIADLGGGRFALSVEGFGLWILAVDGPKLTEVAALETAQNLHLGIAVSADKTRLMTADWTMARLFDVTDPAQPAYIAGEWFGAERAIAVTFSDGSFWVGGVGFARRITPVETPPGPELFVAERALQIEVLETYGSEGSAALLINNWGTADLDLSNLKTSDSRLVLGGIPDSGIPGVTMRIAAGEVGFLELAAKGVEPLTGTVSMDTNDPASQSLVMEVAINPARLQVGQTAADFVTPSVSGPIIRYMDVEGSVYMKIFNAY